MINAGLMVYLPSLNDAGADERLIQNRITILINNKYPKEPNKLKFIPDVRQS